MRRGHVRVGGVDDVGIQRHAVFDVVAHRVLDAAEAFRLPDANGVPYKKNNSDDTRLWADTEPPSLLAGQVVGVGVGIGDVVEGAEPAV